jgi:hypothetical protein
MRKHHQAERPSECDVLLKNIRKEVIGLLYNRYIFRTIQEIIRRHERLDNYPEFNQWTWVVYAVANSVGVRRLAGQRYDNSDTNLMRLLDMIMKDVGKFVDAFARHFPTEFSSEGQKEAGSADGSWQALACRRLIGKDRKILLHAAKKAVNFANKRVAHNNPDIDVSTTFDDLDDAIETLKCLAEKYLLLAYERKHDLHKEMKQTKLRDGWDGIFLETWATQETLALPLGEMTPPRKRPKI